jgi:outer membrane biosynthesis protein TonB
MRAIRLLLVCSLLVPAVAHAQQAKLKPEAQLHLDAALKAYEAKDYDAAFKEFDLAYAVDPNPALLYATAQALRHANKCTQAIATYKRFLETKPPEQQVAAANSGIATCEDVLKKQPAPKPEPKPEPSPEPKPEPKPEPAPSPSTPSALPLPSTPPPHEPAWYAHPIPDAMVVTGAIGIGVGVVFLTKAGSSEQAAKTAMFRDDFVRLLDDATSQRRIGAIALTAGSAIAVGGILVYMLHERRGSHQVVGGIDGRSLFVAGTF